MSELASSLSWAVMTAARRHGVVIDSVRLNAAITQSMVKSGAAAIDINSLCAALSLPKSQHLAKPDRAQLPMLGVVRERGWGVIADQRPDGRWIFISEEGHALVSDSDLSEGAYKLDFAPLGNKPDQHGFERVFKEALGEYRPIILEVVIASVVMSVIALGASVFSMQVYDRVIPTHGVATLIVLAIGVSLAIVFELGMKFARSHIMDSVVSGLDAKLSQALFERLLSVRVDQLPGSVGSLAGQLRGYEQIRSFYTSQTLFTLVDLPLGLLFVLVIAFIASPWMALVPTVFGLAAIGIGYLSNRKVVRLADKSAAASNLKTGLLVETVEGVETIKSGSGGWKFLSRWIDVSAESIRSDMAMRAIGDHAGYIAAMLQQLSYSTTVIVGSFLVINGQITMGALIACSILGGRILAPVAMIPGLMVQRAHTKATLAGLEKIYALQTDQGNERQLTPDTLRGEFRVEEVKFTYAGSLLNAMSIDQLSIRASVSNRFRQHASPARKVWKSVSRRPSEEARCQMPQVPSRTP
ncbi:ABC transporter transmembrane domain-containing protein [Herbaspirillum sp. 1130]|uniref:ABC transporter transmembrane domain-containing protein n=1 Tax=Herbaspirillum sp. 1130 TaxID=2806562 RepID=UPI001B42EA0A|nr:ABC transporter transmembrane domain-containing protein [Herbaspirillum sp. 1130]MBP1314107.1 ATP-binding cassette subfamily C protein LapB [Herbaspirillum sp. 1130]